MVSELIAYAVLVVAVPLVWAAQGIHDWWASPARAFRRQIWFSEHPTISSRLAFRRVKDGSKGGSSAVRASSASSTPGHACSPRAGVGPQLQATAPAWTRGSATTAPDAEPHPTSGDLPDIPTGRGPQLRTATTDRCPRLRSAASGGPGQQPVDVAMPPDATSTGPQRRTP
jgi:hypothetical protein